MGRGKNYTDEYKEMIVDLYDSGMTVTEISSEYGIAKSTIHRWIKSNQKVKVSDDEFISMKEIAKLKKEDVYRNIYKTYEDAKLAIFSYIESWYNNKRLHSAINYRTPNKFEILSKNAA